ncbi:enoyl-CoA hydratase-related protein [Streptomyces scopuliridis]|uniref:Enoyl-CoA hydratase-related protein n=1 Tax=Streptomyces scopuliridis TaxID=452529 RepID=A0ACD4ZEJ9_9ACTN|nr:enoyl-CoA hydratase-related protein [Streptomyces scopuliridis]WSB96773.1 enoyl-CoA hydratase-related protein [Streptomyces scopuliridis]WSC09523.1 enoyl-CoA hydratase-related protein [Streptomyces scopuliridis]
MRILLVSSAFNSLTQRVFVELRDRGHLVGVQLALNDDALREAVRRHAPELILAPMLTSAIPADVWSAHTCLIVHPGPVGDRGPSSLDWALQEGARQWGVTVLQADAVMDGGDVWATVSCAVPAGVTKSGLYRGEVSDAALEAVLLAVDRVASGDYVPRRQADLPAAGRTRPYFEQGLRRIDWQRDGTAAVLRALRAADSQPGVAGELRGAEWFLHGGSPEYRLRGRPGDLLATRAGAVCRATADGAVWIPELRARKRPGGQTGIKLPAVLALGALLPKLPELPESPTRSGRDTEVDGDSWTDIRYREDESVGVLDFAFPGGAMSTDHCRRLLAAYRAACARPTSVLVLGGGRDFFSNGIHLHVIEAAADPAEESWANIQAMDDLVEAVLTTTDRITVAALGGNAAAGGVMLALAADEVWCRSGVVLNPHYRLMGLYGSEYWTYTLPRRVGTDAARRLTQEALPVSATAARRLGLVDRIVHCGPEDFAGQVRMLAARVAESPVAQRRTRPENDRYRSVTPLSAYREAELARMRDIFFDPQAPYHALRRAFVRKSRPTANPEQFSALPGTPTPRS